MPLEKSSNGDVTSEEKAGELVFDAQPSRREGKRKILGPTPKLITIPIDKYKKASPRKTSNGKNSSLKGRRDKSKGIPVQSFGDPSHKILNLPPGDFNFSTGSNHNIAYPNPSSS